MTAARSDGECLSLPLKRRQRSPGCSLPISLCKVPTAPRLRRDALVASGVRAGKVELQPIHLGHCWRRGAGGRGARGTDDRCSTKVGLRHSCSELLSRAPSVTHCGLHCGAKGPQTAASRLRSVPMAPMQHDAPVASGVRAGKVELQPRPSSSLWSSRRASSACLVATNVESLCSKKFCCRLC